MAEKIEIDNFSAWYGEMLVLRKINLQVVNGDITAIIGPSGCGKSTLLRSLNRMNDLIPGFKAEGKILIDGDEVTTSQAEVINLRRRVGMLFQRPNPFPMSIFENVAYGLRLAGKQPKSELEQVIQTALERAALWDEVKDRLKKSALSLSGGQQQRLCLARALAVGPEVILMDEPCSALDPIATLKIEELMRDLRGQVTMVIVTHNMQQAGRVSDWTAFMMAGASHAGEIIEVGKTTELFTTPKDSRTEDYITGRFG